MTIVQNLKVGQSIKLNVTPIYEIYYQNGNGIYNCELENGVNIVIKGKFLFPLNIHQFYEIEGKVVLHRYEKQIDVSTYRSTTPKGAYKVITYLKQLKGLKKRAEIIYENFGDKSIEMIKKHPEKVAQTIKGISEKRAKEWQEELLQKESEEKDILFLLNLGLSAKQAQELRKNYGNRIRQQISDNPYILLSVKGVINYGFLRCDQLARKMGLDFSHPSRIKEGILHCLKEAGHTGHTFLPKETLKEVIQKTLGITLTISQMKSILQKGIDEITVYSRKFKIDLNDLEKRVNKIDSLVKETAKEKYRYPLFRVESKHIETALDELQQEGKIAIHLNRIALMKYEEAELSISKNVARLSFEQDWKIPFDIEKELDDYLKQNGFVLEKKQREAVINFSKKRGNIHLLLGSAGTGKTFTLKIILAMLEKVMKANNVPFKVKVLTPTGKAAKVASKATGYPAETIHRGLEFHPDLGFQRNLLNPLDATVLVVDETSMMDVSLASALFEAISTGTTVILMGDIKQLPSVGAGHVLRDLANSRIIDKVELDVVKRQGLLSGIYKNANLIIEGKMMESFTDTNDAFILHEEDNEKIRRKILASINRLMNHYHYSLEEIQVLSPQKKGSVGVYELNALIQAQFNPNQSGEKIRNPYAEKIQLYFMKGDKVIHKKNNKNTAWYDKTENGYVPQSKFGITNGETGVIEDIETVVVNSDEGLQKQKRIIVRYEEGYVFYNGEELKELDHAYCLSIHKSQGSQWKAVLIPVSTQHSFFLDRNLIYTAWTRAMLFGAIIGSKKTLAISIKKDKAIERFTQLQQFLEKQKPLNYH